MSATLYELRFYREGRPVTSLPPILYPLDLSDVETTRDLLKRHLLGAVERSGAHQAEAHLFHLEAHATQDGRGYGDPVFRFALPINPEAVEKWR